MTQVWRIHIKTGAKAGVDPHSFCRDKGVLGVGWPVDAPGRLDWDTYHDLATKRYYNEGDRGWWAAVNALRNRMGKDDLCWSRDQAGIYWLARLLDEEWRYEGEEENIDADVVNVRNCDWVQVGAADAAPGKVIASCRRGLTVQRIKDKTVELFSKHKYNSLSQGSFRYDFSPRGDLDIFSLLSSEDCEDLVALYLQERGYRVITSTCKSDTKGYEYVLQHRDEGRVALVQVKNQDKPMDTSPYSDGSHEWYLFSPRSNFVGDVGANMHLIRRNEIDEFMTQNPQLLPERIRDFLQLSNVLSGQSSDS